MTPVVATNVMGMKAWSLWMVYQSSWEFSNVHKTTIPRPVLILTTKSHML
jgi:hypothetical protein